MSMSKEKDCAFKLFGKPIPILEVLPSKRDIDRKLQDDGNANCPSKEAEDLNGSTESPESKAEDDQRNTRSSQVKHLKKPDRIIPCPRCNSMETKFCYYNNYNLSQPRYFCRNCQRYWTAGGAMRNVPVGSGRRKNKIPSPQYGHVSVFDGVGYGACYPTAYPNGHGMLESLLKNQSSMSFNKENGENGPSIMQNGRVYPPQLPFFAGTRWPYLPQWVPPMPNFYPSSASWGYAIPPPLSTTLNSQALGKHYREAEASRQSDNGEEQKESEESGNERSLWFPKTLKIDHDLGETSERSIWETLGVEHGKRDPKGGIFEAFKSNANEKSESRSHDIRERS